MKKIETFLKEKVNFFQSWIDSKKAHFLIKQPIIRVSVFLIVLTSLITIFNLTNEQKIMPLKESYRGIIGGPFTQKTLATINGDSIKSIALAANNQTISTSNAQSPTSETSETKIYYLIDNNSLLNPNPILTSIKTEQNGILIYKVQKGDTLLSIASEYGVSLNTIRWANNLKGEKIIPGEELIILPVSGVLHEIKAGDTIEKIAKTYSAEAEKIISYNNLNTNALQPGQKIIIPEGKISSNQQKNNSNKSSSSLPDYPYYYVIPTTGFNWGTLHSNNGVDIANRCNTPIMAAAEGLVIAVGRDNGGYGNFIKIQHPNNTETLYAHLNKVSVSEGDYVNQGQLIGLMGNTGYVIGNSGCHLHFQVHNAKNPFVK